MIRIVAYFHLMIVCSNSMFAHGDQKKQNDSTLLTITTGIEKIELDNEDQLFELNLTDISSEVTLDNIEGDGSNFERLELSNRIIRTINFRNIKAKVIRLENCVIDEIIIGVDSEVDSLFLNGSEIKSLVIRNSHMNYVSLQESKALNQFFLQGKIGLNSIDFRSFNVKDTASFIDFSEIESVPGKDTIFLFFEGANFRKLEMNYKHFSLAFPDNHNNDHVRVTYLKLLEFFNASGQKNNYKKLFKEYKLFETEAESKTIWSYLFGYWLPDFWWGFGLEKYKVVYNTLGLYLVCSFIALFFLRKLNDAYGLVSLKKKLHPLGYTYYSLVYMGILFFGLKFEVSNLQFDKYISLFILITYTAGLVCVAYLANLVITI
ncbi:MAG: hypothetical protein IM631_08765 [Cytophagales bacterium]|jgi:hypothetical protein|nr:hypothetical protein [Cytophagales bacterium]MCA6371480.1 hypothetical protein [Cytophagales bacterium]MCA6377833.1 hypothetical protein [Cytophagales bacterium]MCA6385273.1 hypothetical protein [Cytophagales bacterium]MCE2895852.1 hypothetical protein [Flammeovirgaceae bacterium]